MNVTRYKCSVLAVDDDPAILSLLSIQLGNDFEMLTACSVEQARGLLAQRSVDIVLTDLQLPDEPGLALLDWVRRTTPRTSRILITGTARLEDAADAINQTQVHRLVLKPWRSEDLLQSLRAVSRGLLLERSHEQLLDELRKLNLELEQRVIDRTRELENALTQLQLKNLMLEKMALTDPLTGLSNRRAIDLIARKELLRRSRVATPLTVVLIDIDHFKQINTNYLLSGGDHLLAWLAGVLQNSIRAQDSLARVGGEEFLVIAPNTDATGAVVLAERLRENVASGSTAYNGQSIGVTISLGLAVADVSMTAAYDDLRECAAGALKEAKDTGRNRAVIRILTPS
ncbi:MAG TPA: diguanylate cyclase [Gemmata sp.]|jgi:diguanylate cyclase (GGDEF)-like protein|nr:diguanylate cyclase [Gemmata sp.]